MQRFMVAMTAAALAASCGDETVRGVEIGAEFTAKAEGLTVAIASRMDTATLRRLNGVPEVWPGDEPPLKMDVAFASPVIVDFTQRNPDTSGVPGGGRLPPDPVAAQQLRLRIMEVERCTERVDGKCVIGTPEEELTPAPVSIDLYVGLPADPGPGEIGTAALLVGRAGVVALGQTTEVVLAPGGDTLFAKALRAKIFKMWLVLTVPVDTEKNPRRPTGKTSYHVRIATDFVG